MEKKAPATGNTIVLMPYSVKVAALLAFAEQQGFRLRSIGDNVILMVDKEAPVETDLSEEFNALPELTGVKPSEVVDDAQLASAPAAGPAPCGCKNKKPLASRGA